ncbi:SusC/RagA family TonB-linked outer membrane protein [Zobellia uliginosa]|uniref:SusC/RagA family TonB-linked outer membrane protein n=1 Tax=Zobellia uliginosa TaxID=143224 RepID=UPI0026E19DF5|nr:TonB-dependent receptor [Zobellia uliginosa]
MIMNICIFALIYSSSVAVYGAEGNKIYSINSLNERKTFREVSIIPTKFGLVNITKVQETTISGTITDSNGSPLPGASIVEKGTTNGTESDFDGNFSIELSGQDSILVISYIGFISKEMSSKGKSKFDIVLEESASYLDEVVVVGYGTQRKVDLTGAVSVVDVEASNRQPSAQIAEQLQGRVSGVTISTSGQPGASPQIRIRGINTFGNGNPLYVVDGIPAQDISNINSNDIASMQILKDAGSASIYGARAANGVILITTKKGTGKLSVSYNGYAGIQTPPRGNVYNILSPQEQADLKWIALQNSNPGTAINDIQYGSGSSPVLPYYIKPAGAAQGEVDESTYFLDPFYSNPNQLGSFNQIIRANPEGTNWFQEIFNPASIQSHDISIGQGGEKGNVLFSLNYFNQEGTMKHIFLKRYTARINSQYNFSDNFRVGQNLNYSIAERNLIPATNPILHSYRLFSIVPVYDIAGNFAGSTAPDTGSGLNPVAALERNKDNLSRTNRFFGNIFAELDVFNAITFRSSFGGNFYNTNGSIFSSPEYENQANQITASQLTENVSTGFNWTWTNTAQFKKKFKEAHDFSFLVGSEAYHNQYKDVQAIAQGFYSPNPDFINLSNGSGTQTNSGFFSEDALFSLFSRLDYIYEDKYILGATVRRDATSRFTNPRHGWFPALSAGWRISQEKFMENVDWISELKIRGGYGVMGNQANVDPANSFTTFGSNRSTSFYDTTGSNNSIVEGFQKVRIGNPNAQWEKNINSNIGIDVSLFNSSLQLTVDYYRKDVKDLLFNPELTATSGAATAPFINIAEMKNSGLDMSLNTYFDLAPDFRMNATLNLTTYKNEIVNISDGAENFDQSVGRSGIVRNQVGHSVGQFFGYQIDGFWNDQTEIDQANSGAQAASGQPDSDYQTDIGLGRFRYRDVNNDGIITTDDRTFIGNPNPDFTAGLNLEFVYKNVDLSLFLYGVSGNDILNNVKGWTDFYGTFVGAKSHTALYDSWTPQNKNATAPIQETGSNFSTASAPNSYFIEDGSYMRLKNIQLGFTLPNSITEKLGIQNLRLYLQGSDLFTITNYSGVDPELTGSPTAFGIDNTAYPSSSTILLGLNAKF